MTIAIDTKKSFEYFIGAGFNEQQAEALIQFEINKDRSDQLTKKDILHLRTDLEEKILQVDRKIDATSASLKIWFLTALLTQTFALGGLMFALLTIGSPL